MTVPAHCRCGTPNSDPQLHQKANQASHQEKPVSTGPPSSDSLPALSICPAFSWWWTLTCKLKQTLSFPVWYWLVFYPSNRKKLECTLTQPWEPSTTSVKNKKAPQFPSPPNLKSANCQEWQTELGGVKQLIGSFVILRPNFFLILFNSVCFNCRWRGLSDANFWNKTGINGPAPEILTGLRLSSVWLTDYCLVQRFFKWPQLPSSLLSFSVCSFLCLYVCVKVHAMAPVCGGQRTALGNEHPLLPYLFWDSNWGR